jgi:hypothetical protein
MYRPHPVFETPPDDTIIWRYTTWGRLCSVLTENALFFARAETFDDPWESSYPEHQYIQLENWSPSVFAPAGTPKVALEEQARRIRDDFASSRHACVVSCWHMADGESDSHWRIYGHSEEGVAIVSTIGGLKRAVEPYKDRSVKIGKVRYVDFEKDALPAENGFWPVVHKRKAFINDREVRAVIWEREAGPAFGPKGVNVPIDVGALLSEVVVSPMSRPGFEDTVRQVAGRFLPCSVRRSTLLQPPKYRIV